MNDHPGLRAQLGKTLEVNARLKREKLLGLMEDLGIDPHSIPGRLLIAEYRPDTLDGYAFAPIKLWLAVTLGTVVE